MSRSYAPTELKRRLKPALEELEQLGFLEPLDPEERYSWVSRGCWRIILIRGQAGRRPRPLPADEDSALADALTPGGSRPRWPPSWSAPPGGPAPDQARGLRLAGQERGQAGRQEPGRLPRRLDPLGLPGPRRVRAGRAAARTAAARKNAEEAEREPPKSPRGSRQRQSPRGRPPRRWEKLPEAEREAILAAVKADNPGLGRWKNMLEPLCLSELERRLDQSPTQGNLFDGHPRSK